MEERVVVLYFHLQKETIPSRRRPLSALALNMWKDKKGGERDGEVESTGFRFLKSFNKRLRSPTPSTVGYEPVVKHTSALFMRKQQKEEGMHTWWWTTE